MAGSGTFPDTKECPGRNLRGPTRDYSGPFPRCGIDSVVGVIPSYSDLMVGIVATYVPDYFLGSFFNMRKS